MTALTSEQETLQESLADLKQLLAEAEEDLQGKKKDLKATEEEKESIEKYLESIKDGCDFITKNIEERKSNRETETDALNKVHDFLKGTPAYQEFVTKQHEENLGDCLPKCDDESHVRCKACLAKVTEVAYCVN